MEESKENKIKITVDNKATEELVKILKDKEEKQKEEEDRLAKAEVDKLYLQERKTAMIEKTGDKSFNDVSSMDELKEKTDKLLKLGVEASNKHGDLAGSAVLSDAQYGVKPVNSEDFGKMGYNADSIRILRRKAREGDGNAKGILDGLLKKTLKDYGKSHQNIGFSPDSDTERTNAVPNPPTESMVDDLNQSELRKFSVLKKRGGKWGGIPSEAQKAEMSEY